MNPSWSNFTCRQLISFRLPLTISTSLIAKFDSNGRRYCALFFSDDDGNNGRWKVQAGRR